MRVIPQKIIQRVFGKAKFSTEQVDKKPVGEEKVLYADGVYRVPTQGDLMLNQAVEDLFKAVANQDFFEAVKKLGVIELLNKEEIPFYSGMAYMSDWNDEKIIEYFTQVPESSMYYSFAMRSLATSYEHTGKYQLLNELIGKHCFEISPLEELRIRLKCLERMDIEDFVSSYDQLRQISSTQVKKMPDNETEQRYFYSICRVLLDTLCVAGEMINQCWLYKKNVPESGYDFESYPETALFIKAYRKCVYILEYSRCLKFIKLSNNIESLAICALVNKHWKDKIRIFDEGRFAPMLVQLVFDMGRPELHPATPPYACLEKIMDRYSYIAPAQINGIISEYFDIISKAATEGNKSAKDYMGLSYSQILVTGKDKYNVKDRLEEFKANNPSFNFDEILGRAELTHTMSRKGHDALLNAEYTFDIFTQRNYGNRDASGLALLFFRVLEIEYNEKLIKPFANALDFNEIKGITGFCKTSNRCSIDTGYKMWMKDLEGLFNLQTGSRDSLEIGVIRTLLAHIWHRTDSCAVYLLNALKTHLTQKGRDALYTERMMDVIGKANVDMYRNPGAHTGFVPYSKACDASTYVRTVIPEIEAWFTETV